MKANRMLTPLKAIRQKCNDCSCWQPKEVRLCSHTDCALYSYRFGHNPNRRGVGGNLIQKNAAETGKITKEEVLDD